MTAFRPSVAWLALKHGIDVLPVYVEGTYRSMPRGSHRRGHICRGAAGCPGRSGAARGLSYALAARNNNSWRLVVARTPAALIDVTSSAAR